jgi:2,4-dienoyl-CoA reductase (NADPH2)
VGKSFPVWCRIDATEFETEGGITFEDAQRTAELAEAAGADAIHVSAYADPMKSYAFTQAPLVHTPMGFVDFAARIKKRVGVPVIAVGRIDPDEAESVIAQGKADFIAMGRKLLADPDLPNKIKTGQPEDIRPCIYCYVCVGEIFLNRCLRCAVNPQTGHEFEVNDQAASPAKEVLVIGGGPAGMEAARIAALRGHRVTLLEKSRQLGGTLFFAALAYEANTKLVRWLDTQVRKLPIELKLGCEATPELVKELNPDAIVVAIGARRQAPDLPGIERPFVYSGDDLRQLFSGTPKSGASKLNAFQRTLIGAGRLAGATKDVESIRKLTKLWMPLGKRVAIIGGGLVGVELAEFLLERGREVTVLEESKSLASSMSVPRRWRSLHALRSHQVRLETQACVEAIEENAVIWRNAAGEQETLPVDAVILASGTEANRKLGEQLQKDFSEVHLIGDCSGLGYIEGALADAARIGCEL